MQIGGSNFQRDGIGFDTSAAEFVIEALVGHDYRVGSDLVVEAATATVAPHAANFEDVGVIGGERNSDRYPQRREAVVDDTQFLVRNVAPQKSRADDVQGAAWNDDGLTLRDVDVREVGDEREVIRFDRRTEQQRARLPESQSELRQVAGATEEYSMFAEAERFDIAI